VQQLNMQLAVVVVVVNDQSMLRIDWRCTNPAERSSKMNC